jgi:hypothetical protein
MSSERFCSICGSTETYLKRHRLRDGSYGKPYKMWYNDHQGGWLCNNCCNSHIYGPKRDALNNPRRIVFEDKRLYLDTAPRTGVCNWCRAVVGEINVQVGILCKRTNMHHLIYDKSNPAAHAIEICVSCHSRHTLTSWML